MRAGKATFRLIVALALVVLYVATVAQPAAAQGVEIPGDAVIDSATLSLYKLNTSGEAVNVHLVTADWTEGGVTWNNFGGYDPVVVGSIAGGFGWRSVDVTAIVQDWVTGSVPNYGFLLEQSTEDYGAFFSSEYSSMVELRPKLEICYTASTGSACVVIQRGTLGEVADAYIWEQDGDANHGAAILLTAGLVDGFERQSLIRFFFDVAPPPPSGEGCTLGFWRQDHHYDSWVGYAPADDFNLVFGVSSSFDPRDLSYVVQLGGGGEEALGRHAVAALLNASAPDVGYLYTEAEVIAMVQSTYASGDFEGIKDLFEVQNEIGCPLN